jgi:hypothetical protein
MRRAPDSLLRTNCGDSIYSQSILSTSPARRASNDLPSKLRALRRRTERPSTSGTSARASTLQPEALIGDSEQPARKNVVGAEPGAFNMD